MTITFGEHNYIVDFFNAKYAIKQDVLTEKQDFPPEGGTVDTYVVEMIIRGHLKSDSMKPVADCHPGGTRGERNDPYQNVRPRPPSLSC